MFGRARATRNFQNPRQTRPARLHRFVPVESYSNWFIVERHRHRRRRRHGGHCQSVAVLCVGGIWYRASNPADHGRIIVVYGLRSTSFLRLTMSILKFALEATRTQRSRRRRRLLCTWDLRWGLDNQYSSGYYTSAYAYVTAILHPVSHIHRPDLDYNWRV